MPPWAFSCRHLLVCLSVQINTCVMMIFKMIHAKYSLKFCAIGLYFISIVTCLPTVSALAQASDYETCLLSVSKVTPLYISLWTAAVLSAPKSLENIKIIYAYPRDAVDVEKMTERNTDNWLVGEIDNDRQLVIGRPSSQEKLWGLYTIYTISRLVEPYRCRSCRKIKKLLSQTDILEKFSTVFCESE